MPRTVVWFRNDLRVEDNPVLAEAVKNAKNKHEIVPVFCFDDRAMAARNVIDRRPGHRQEGEPKMGPHRAKFAMEAVNDLQRSLQGIGSDLFIYYDHPERVIPGLLSDSGKDVVVTAEEVTYEEQRVDAKVRSAISGKAKLQQVWSNTLYHIEDLPFSNDLSDLPDVFTPFKNKVESKCKVRDAVPAPQSGELPVPGGVAKTEPAAWDKLPLAEAVKKAGPPSTAEHAVLNFEGGETAATKRLKYYLWDADLLRDYFNTRNGMLGGDYSTKFSPWLAHGCISPRTIYHEISKYESKRAQNKSTYWVVFELTWRDFYRFFAIKHGNSIFFEVGTVGKHLEWNSDPQVFEDWKQGRTGMPLVDANMRELSATGFMSNRGRQNVASYLVLDLGVDWRLGADWFEHLLIDHDVTSNWGNWVAAAGLTGGRVNKFNIMKQSKDYDEEGDYVRTWLPELRDVPKAHVHEPSSMPHKLAADIGFKIGETYPNPIPASKKTTPQGNHRHSGGKGGGGGGGKRGSGPPKGARKTGKQRRAPVNMY